MEYGLIGALVLVASIYAIFQVFTAPISGIRKILWTLGIVLFPIAGFIVWLIAGPRGGTVRA
ncbi:PLDc N-terminal domain-containing protein [uncultured Sulfitobacter sp.]|uniref:PLDc N-terminal domain-containing protein n=1 Tax=uncultured Sulfitobacter sp. TaxID=191468 RepID=UPI002611E093|nr:PLDc N-terminal domain-containing protein [uncultured Sulfitobacter sp.]